MSYAIERPSVACLTFEGNEVIIETALGLFNSEWADLMRAAIEHSTSTEITFERDWEMPNNDDEHVLPIVRVRFDTPEEKSDEIERLFIMAVKREREESVTKSRQ